MTRAYLVSTSARELRAAKRILSGSNPGSGLAVGRGVKGNVDDGFELDRGALFGSGAEFPLAQRFHGVGVELIIDAAHQLNAVDGAVAANDGVEHDLALDVLFDLCGR